MEGTVKNDHTDAAIAVLSPLLNDLTAPQGPAPGLAAIVATPHDIPLLFTGGVLQVAGSVQVTPDTGFYIASQTKSYIGVLAAQLDRKGIFSLETRLSDVWPALQMPAPAEPSAITMCQLLSHQLPLRNDELADRTSYREDVSAAQYPAELAKAEGREPGFCYDNLGYLTYAAALETATARSWKDWIAEELCGPLGLTRTSARLDDFGPSELAWRHIWEGGRWRPYPPKPNALMHAAGGLFTSSRDLATWIQANLRQCTQGIPRDVFERAQRPLVNAEAVDGPIHWTSYALGQQVGRVRGIEVIGHRGGYAGARSITIFSHSLQVGLALAVSADYGTREILDRLVGLFFGSFADDASAAHERNRL